MPAPATYNFDCTPESTLGAKAGSYFSAPDASYGERATLRISHANDKWTQAITFGSGYTLVEEFIMHTGNPHGMTRWELVNGSDHLSTGCTGGGFSDRGCSATCKGTSLGLDFTCRPVAHPVQQSGKWFWWVSQEAIIKWDGLRKGHGRYHWYYDDESLVPVAFERTATVGAPEFVIYMSELGYCWRVPEFAPETP